MHQEISKCKGKEDDTEVNLQNEIDRLKTENGKLKKDGYEKDNILKAFTDASARRDETG